MDLYGILERIKAKGHYPVLAHPERYGYMEKEEYQRIKDMGVKLQLNLFSIVGAYGKQIQEKAEQLLKFGVYDLIGSDLHSEKSGTTYSRKRCCININKLVRKQWR